MESTDNLAAMPGFAHMNGVAVDANGRADPQTQLFRSSALGVEKGPMISQVRRARLRRGVFGNILKTPVYDRLGQCSLWCGLPFGLSLLFFGVRFGALC